MREARSSRSPTPGRRWTRPGSDPSGSWAEPPEHWIEEAEDRIEAVKLADLLRVVLDTLPARQREVVLLRDVEE